MTKTQAIAAIKQLPGMTARSTFAASGDASEIRVTFTGLPGTASQAKLRAEEAAYYTNDPADALGTAKAMFARHPAAATR